MKMHRVNLKSMGERDLGSFLAGFGLPAFRTRQLLHWIYGRYAASIDEVTEFSRDLRRAIGEKARIGNLELVERLISIDGTEKYLFGLEDGERIESVLIPEEDRLTLCVSSQVGCAMGCRFCLTARGGLRRNLLAHEIADQVVAVSRLLGGDKRVTNIVLMGMGEPLRNLPEVAEALDRITGYMGIFKRRITVSTSGVADMIGELSRVAPDVNLAVSINATTDEVRDRIMPVNRKFPLARLLAACRSYPLAPRRRITFEYVLLEGVNDTPADARRLIRLLAGIPSKVNLIPFNEFEGAEFRRPSDDRVLGFQSILVRADLAAPVRKSKGQDILAACGQLRRRDASEEG